MSIGLGVTKVVTAEDVELNGSENTALLTYVASKPVKLQRFGVVSTVAAGLLAPTRLKMRKIPVTTGTAEDIAGAGVLNPGGAQDRGVLVYKDAEGSVFIDAGDSITIAVDTAAGAANEGRVWLEVVEYPFSGSLVPDTAVKSA